MKITNYLFGALSLAVVSTATAATYYDDYLVTGTVKPGANGAITLNSEGYWCAQFSAKAGTSYTVTVTGSEGAADVELGYSYKDEEKDVYFDTLGSSEDDYYSDTIRFQVAFDDWTGAFIIQDPEDEWDKADWKEMKVSPTAYYLLVTGEPNQTVTLAVMNGLVKESIPKGMPGNEDSLTVTAKPSTKTVTLSDRHEERYYVALKLAAGVKYFFTTAAGSEAQLDLSATKPVPDVSVGDDDTETDDEGEEGGSDEEDTVINSEEPLLVAQENGICVVPVKAGTYYLEINTGATVETVSAWMEQPVDEMPVNLMPALGKDETGSAVQTLSATDWQNIYRIDARKDVAYTVWAESEEGVSAYYPVRIYTKSGSAEKVVAIADLRTGYTFKATANTTYYLAVYADAPDFTASYKVYSEVSAEGHGILTLNLLGPAASQSATWSLTADKSPVPLYGDGSVVILPAGSHTVKFAAVKDWSTPANQTFTVVAGETTTADVKYNDTSDPKDNTAAGAVAITPTRLAVAEDGSYSGGLVVARSLWAGDAADWFKFTVAKDDEFWYSITFDGKGDLSNLSAEVYLVSGTTFNEKTATLVPMNGANGLTYLKKGTYFVKVSGSDYDAPYAMTIGSADFGAVAFDKKDTLDKNDSSIVTKPAYSFAENAQFAVVKVNRTTGVSALKVRFTTVADTAKPGVDYQPVTTVLEWADGEKAAKTVNIPLIPDLTATYEDNKVFKVALTVDEPDGVASEYPVIPLAVATVELKEVSKIAPGTIAFTQYENGDGDTVGFTDLKKPVLTVASGDEAVVWVARQGGANGAVGVTVEAVKGSALAETDFATFKSELIWADGEMDAKEVRIPTVDNGPGADKAFTVKLTALAKDASGAALQKPTLAAASATVTIRSGAVVKRLEEDAALAKTVKGTKGVWYFDEMGDFKSMVIAAGKTETLSFTVTGPGRLAFTPDFSGDAAAGDKLVVTIGKEKPFECVSGEEVVRYLGAGSQTVKLALTRGKTSAEDVALTLTGYPAEDGLALFDWRPLAVPSLSVPSDKAVVGEASILKWQGVSDDSSVSYKVYLSDNKSALTKSEGKEALSDEIALDAFNTVSLVAGKTYYWRVDAVMKDGDVEKLVAVNPAVWQFTVAAEGAAAKPVLKTVSASGAVGEAVDTEEPLSLVQGVAVATALTSETEGVTFKVLSGKLPDGLKLVTDAKTKATSLVGVPTKPGTYTAVIQSMLGTKAGETLALTFEVAPLHLAEGTFNGVVFADGDVANLNEGAALVNFTATTAGKLTANVTLGGVKYPFTGDGYSLANDADGEYLTASLVNIAKSGKTAVTNELTLSVYRGDGAVDEDYLARLAEPAAVELTINSAVWHGNVYRMNAKDSAYLAAVKAAEGYYTVSLPVANADAEAGDPQGAGYLAVTIDAKGGVKLAGALGDGLAVSATATAVCRLGDCFGTPSVEIPFYLAKNKEVCAGVIVLVAETVEPLVGEPQEVLVVDPIESVFVWANADAASTYTGETGFALELHPVGGFYDKLFNLQAYYLNRSLKVDLWEEAEEGLPSEFFAKAGAGLNTVLASPDEMDVTLVGDTMTVAKKTLVKRTDNNKLYDLAQSDNASNFAVKFARATGLVSGTFSLWLGDAAGAVQKEATGIKFAGVLTPYKAEGSAYTDCPVLGYFTVPVNLTAPKARTWNASYLFKIVGDDITAANEELWQSEGWNK